MRSFGSRPVRSDVHERRGETEATGESREEGPEGIGATLQDRLGNRATARLLSLSEPSDPAEREAAGTAASALCTSAAVAPPSAPVARLGHDESRGRDAAVVERALATSGEPLRDDVRSFFSARYQRPFGDVRVHTGPAAAESARALGARAYTVGADIVLGERGAVRRQAEHPSRLLAHELAHVAQAQAHPPEAAAPLPVLRDTEKGEGEGDEPPEVPEISHDVIEYIEKIHDSEARLKYAQAVEAHAIEAAAAIRRARELGQVDLAQQIAREANEYRNDLRLLTQHHVSPGAEVLSRAIERDRSWAATLKRYAVLDPYATSEAIALASGRTNPEMLGLAKLGVLAAPILTGIAIGSAVDAVWTAPEGQRLRVGANVVGANLGAVGGSNVGMAAGAGAVGLLVSNPGGWAILAGMGLGYLGSKFGGEVGAAIFDMPWRLMAALEALARLPEILQQLAPLVRIAALPVATLADLMAGGPLRVRASLDVSNWDLRYFPPPARDAALAVGRAIWHQVHGMSPDELIAITRKSVSELGVSPAAMRGLATALSDPTTMYDAGAMLAMKPLDFVQLLASRKLAFEQSPTYLQGYSIDEGNLQFSVRSEVRLRRSLEPDNWAFEKTTAPHAERLVALGQAVWEKLSPLNPEDFALASRQTIGQLVPDVVTVEEAALAIADMMRARSTAGIQYDLDGDALRPMTPQDFVDFLLGNVGLTFRVGVDASADAAVEMARQGYEPW